jgi:D-3-phosphoglycerate dehydrogenase
MSKIWQEAKLDPEAEAMLNSAAEIIGPRKGPVGTDPLAGIEQADAAIVSAWVTWDTALFNRASRLKAISRTGIGYDNIVVPDATACGVCVLNTPEAPTESTAEFTIALMLCLARKLSLAERRFRTEGWVNATELIGVDLAEKTLGLAGLGRIGTRVAEVARALRMKVIAYDPAITAETARARGAERVPDLQTLLAASDVISLHLPLTPQNRGLIGARELAQMKRGAMLINAARGPILVEADLLAALKSGHLGGAALDVWEPEPARADNPLLKLDNVVAAPHIAAATVEGRRRSHLTAAADVLQLLRGQRPANLVNPEVWTARRP